VGVHLGVWGVHSLTLSYTPKSMKCDSWLSLLAFTFASPCLRRKSKAKVATNMISKKKENKSKITKISLMGVCSNFHGHENNQVYEIS
jgi:hypothetical protein